MPNKNASKGGSKEAPSREYMPADVVDGAEEKHSYSGSQVGDYKREPSQEI